MSLPPVTLRHARVLAATLALAGCASKEPAGGNVVVDDTRPEPRPAATPVDPDGGDAMVDTFEGGTYGDASLEGAATTACDECACSPDTHYCFGGNYEIQPQIPGDAGDAGLPACAVVGSGSASVAPPLGCNTIPSACAGTPTCECIIAALQPAVSCYLVCAHPGAQIRVACPTP